MPTFTDFIPTFPTVNRKFLITDFRLLSTSVKRENFIDFYRSQKKVKDPRSLEIFNTVTWKHVSQHASTHSSEGPALEGTAMAITMIQNTASDLSCPILVLSEI